MRRASSIAVWSPNIMVPRHSAETWRLLFPRVLYCMGSVEVDFEAGHRRIETRLPCFAGRHGSRVGPCAGGDDVAAAQVGRAGAIAQCVQEVQESMQRTV